MLISPLQEATSVVAASAAAVSAAVSAAAASVALVGVAAAAVGARASRHWLMRPFFALSQDKEAPEARQARRPLVASRHPR